MAIITMSTSLSGYVLVSSLNQDYARMIAEDVGETERLALVGLSPESIEEVEFNVMCSIQHVLNSSIPVCIVNSLNVERTGDFVANH